ncbi:MAG TPA: hypothetical protein DHV14_05940 [Micrococcales bacterium]|uniref:hypothetical protein n=1 Tax=Miniimonas TaxID=947525 RepID=UPI000D529CAC|nr:MULTISPECIES: hypothetical protein [Miniimonas]HCX84667.1 hypothetical protein [Micrococcales bacterium]
MPTLSAASIGWLEELRTNLREAREQSAQERAEAEPILPMPPGSTWGLIEAFPELESQISALESGDDLPDGASQPTKVWYEEGYFKAKMALDWQCAWLSEAVSQYDLGNVEDAEYAVAQLRSFEDNPLVSHFPDYGFYLATYVDPLGPGDTSVAADTLRYCSTASLVPAYREQ